MATRSTHTGGVNVLLGDGSVRMGDGSVRFVSDGVDAGDSFDFTATGGETEIALLLPAVQQAREAARAGDGSVMPDDAQGIIAVLIGLAREDAPFDPGFTGGVMVAVGDVSGDDVVVDGRIITAENWDA